MQVHMEGVQLSDEGMRRLPAKERSISEIGNDDFRVRVLGMVVDRNEKDYSVMLDDGTGRIIIQFPDVDQFSVAEEGRLVRVFGRVAGGEPASLEAELIQDMSSLDLGVYDQWKYISDEVKKRCLRQE